MAEGLSSNFETLFGNMEKFITTKTVVGEPVYISGVILVPLVEVTFGVGAGAASSADKGEKPGNKDAGGGAMGGKIVPSAVLVIINGAVQLVNVKNQDSVNKLIDMVPGILSKFNLGGIFGKKDKEGKDDSAEDAAAE